MLLHDFPGFKGSGGRYAKKSIVDCSWVLFYFSKSKKIGKELYRLDDLYLVIKSLELSSESMNVNSTIG